MRKGNWKYSPGRWTRADGAAVEKVTAGKRKGTWRAIKPDGKAIMIASAVPPVWQGYYPASHGMSALDAECPLEEN